MPDFSFEDACGTAPVCGVDEVGRGPLAGPVVAAAVIFRPEARGHALLTRIQDSKTLTAKARADIAAALPGLAHISIAEASVEEIDRLNILQATFLAMRRAVEGLPLPPQMALIDGNRAPKSLPCKTQTIVKGDARSLSIAAASIAAKEHRDQIMRALAEQHPPYGWARNAGYGTAEHLKALRTHGPTEWHRRSFKPVRSLVS